jgi:hypothetical protein
MVHALQRESRLTLDFLMHSANSKKTGLSGF